MRQLKPTPLLVVSVGLLLYGLYLLIFVDPGEEGWGTLFAMVVVGAGIVGLAVYALLRTTLKKRIRTQVIIETVLILGILYYSYRKSGAYQFQLPHNYRGYVLVIYGIDDAPKLKTPFYSNKIKCIVPQSGIIRTASLPNDNYSAPAIFVDNTNGEIHKLPPPLKRHSLPLSSGTLKCGHKNYLYDIWLIKDQPNWSAQDDTMNRLDLKLLEACNSSQH